MNIAPKQLQHWTSPGGPESFPEAKQWEECLRRKNELYKWIQNAENLQEWPSFHIHWLHNSQCSSQTDLALVAPGTSMKLKHLQMTSDGCETYANGFRRSKIPKIKKKNRPKRTFLAKVMAIYSQLPAAPTKTPNKFSWGQLGPPNMAGPPKFGAPPIFPPV